MLGRPFHFSLTVGLALLIFASGCERKQRARERDAALARARPTPTRPPPAPLPEEAPFGPLRAENSGFPCAVDDAFAAKCRRCHTVPTRHGAPFVFLTWEDTQQVRNGQPLHQLMARAVKSGFMPYKIAANPAVEPLTEAEKQTILDWLEAGAPREVCDPNAPTPSKKSKAGASARPNASARPSAGAKPNASARPGAGAKPATSASKLPVATGKAQR